MEEVYFNSSGGNKTSFLVGVLVKDDWVLVWRDSAVRNSRNTLRAKSSRISSQHGTEK
jgi:hypothetical protein